MTGADRSDEICARVVEAHRWARPLQIRGSGSRGFLGRALSAEVMDVGAHSGILEWEPSELVLRARAGTPLQEIEHALAGQRQMLGFEPPRWAAGSTLGGAIATGLSGPRRPYVGAARDFVLGVGCVDGRGQRLAFGGRVIKNVAGYDVSRLMCGAHGTLGVLLDIALRLLPMPECGISVARECEPVQAVALMNHAATQPLPLAGAAWDAGLLRFRLEGAESAVRQAARQLGGELEPTLDWWQQLRDHGLPFFAGARRLWRVALPPTAAPLALGADELIDWGGAQRWLAGDVDGVLVRARAAQLGGHATLWRGAAPGDEPFHPLDPSMLELQRQLKCSFDPLRVLNPGRMYREI